jgi:hypothetical protein
MWRWGDFFGTIYSCQSGKELDDMTLYDTIPRLLATQLISRRVKEDELN